MPSGLTPLAGRARWAVIALVAVIATDVLAIGSDWLEIDLMNRVLDGADVSRVDITSLVVDAVAAILAIQVVRRLTARQQERTARTLTGAATMSEA